MCIFPNLDILTPCYVTPTLLLCCVGNGVGNGTYVLTLHSLNHITPTCYRFGNGDGTGSHVWQDGITLLPGSTCVRKLLQGTSLPPHTPTPHLVISHSPQTAHEANERARLLGTTLPPHIPSYALSSVVVPSSYQLLLHPLPLLLPSTN